MEKGQFLQQIVPGKLDIHMPKNELRSSLHAIYKNPLKMYHT